MAGRSGGEERMVGGGGHVSRAHPPSWLLEKKATGRAEKHFFGQPRFVATGMRIRFFTEWLVDCGVESHSQRKSSCAKQARLGTLFSPSVIILSGGSQGLHPFCTLPDAFETRGGCYTWLVML
ncbi:UNVERIFIED_CONTAM: hypothetical protein HHA_449190 [Hammondia hammondi]|eukprot:XP_008881767.1 hypothetical protein HHA_449190 [Hammondia hammondi]